MGKRIGKRTFYTKEEVVDLSNILQCDLEAAERLAQAEATIDELGMVFAYFEYNHMKYTFDNVLKFYFSKVKMYFEMRLERERTNILNYPKRVRIPLNGRDKKTVFSDLRNLDPEKDIVLCLNGAKTYFWIKNNDSIYYIYFYDDILYLEKFFGFPIR